MADVYNPLAVRWVMKGTLMGQSYQTVGYCRLPGSGVWTQEFISGLAAKIKAFWELDLRGILSNQLIINQIECRQMADENPLVAVENSGLSGGSSSTPMPGNVAFVIRAYTERGGRGSSGRVYQGGLTETMVAGNALTPAALTSLVETWQSLIVRLSETGPAAMLPVVYSRYSNNVPRPVALLRDIVSYNAPDNIIDSQRRRLPNRGS